MSQTVPNDAFAQAVSHLRADYQNVRDSTRLVPPAGRPVVEQSIDVVEDLVYHTYWYEDGSPQGQCIRLADIPGTLSGDILRLRRDLPILDGDHEIIGDQIRRLADAPKPPPPYEEDILEDLAAVLASLPVVEVDPDKHFVKKGKYESEIRNLLKCQGGSCPGVPFSPYIIRLLGRSSNDELVFEKFKSRYVLAFVRTLDIYKSWILQLISGLRSLHSLGIIHRDLRIDNLLFSPDNTNILICDLEGQWGIRLAPEVSRQPILDAGWTEKSDIYDLGHMIKACTRELPHERPSLEELCIMVDGINVADSGKIK
ncbi:MAG: hypothetical protein M1840_002129 [Geoglossum simile]|nr:MAG: hypothetical protein M1840_002129 [Geoglossum simile]